MHYTLLLAAVAIAVTSAVLARNALRRAAASSLTPEQVQLRENVPSRNQQLLSFAPVFAVLVWVRFIPRADHVQTFLAAAAFVSLFFLYIWLTARAYHAAGFPAAYVRSFMRIGAGALGGLGVALVLALAWNQFRI